MRPGRILTICFLMCSGTLAVNYWLNVRQHKKIAVVDAVKLFEHFNMKKELEEKAKVKLEAIGKQADSVGYLLKIARASKDEEQIKKRSAEYRYLVVGLENEYKESNDDIDKQVWKRLNPLLMDFGKKRGLHVIIGANGMGSVLYNDDYYDLTEDAIVYTNKRYEDGN